MKNIIVKKNKTLNQYHGKTLFKDKVDLAKNTLAKHGVPKTPKYKRVKKIKPFKPSKDSILSIIGSIDMDNLQYNL